MKQLFKSLMFCFLPFFSFTQTNVGGGIFSNVTWGLSGSPYIMTNSVVVFPNVTLTIEPGVEVLVQGEPNNPFYLEIRGNLNAIGTANNRVVFKSQYYSDFVSAWSGIVVKKTQGASFNINYVQISNAYFALNVDATIDTMLEFNGSYFSHNSYALTSGTGFRLDSCTFYKNGSAVSGWYNFEVNNCKFDSNFSAMPVHASRLWVTNSEFTNNNIGIYQNSFAFEPVIIDSCVFSGNAIGYQEANGGTITNSLFLNNDIALFYAYNMNVLDCEFSQNGTGLIVSQGAVVTDCEISNNEKGVIFAALQSGQTPPNIQNNRICNNSMYHVENNTDLNLSLSTNCFCEFDSSVIEAKIYDGYDDFTRGLINYGLYDSDCDSLLALVFKFVEVTNLKDEQEIQIGLYPNPTSGILYLNGDISLIKSLVIHDVLGKKMVQPVMNGGVVNLSEFDRGYYNVVLVTNTGKQIVKPIILN